MFYLDSNVVIDVIRKKYPDLISHFKNLDSDKIAIPAIVLAELEFGAKHSDNYKKRRKQYLDVISPYKIIPFDEKEAEVYGKIREELSKKGTLIGPNDMLIAATAIANDAVLVTHNTDEFSRVSGIKLEDWIK